jgi:hypothetical protein
MARGIQQQPLQEQAKGSLGGGVRGQSEAEIEDIQDGWEAIKEIDKVLDHLEGRLDRMTAVIRRTTMQDRLQVPAMLEEVAGEAEGKDSLGDLEVPALQSSLMEHRIVNVEPRTEGPTAEVPKVDVSSAPNSAESGSKGEKEKAGVSLEDRRQRAEEEYDKTKGLSHGCRQSWDLRLRGEKGPGLRINGLFHWASGDSLILHEVAKTAGLEGHGSRRKVGTLYMGSVESTCAYWVPVMD